MMVKTFHFKTNINCDECIKKVSPELDALKEIYKWEVNTLSPNKLLTVTGEKISSSKIKAAVKHAGYKIESADSIFSTLHSYFLKTHTEDCCS